ncbi:hypothetical protein F5Y16DRAFT_401835 [Xylariaceae sp. FL0255]|nr:hypothetical protein F5Y16DRAFT_401835 [Xylariaceae sp. FL0255]
MREFPMELVEQVAALLPLDDFACSVSSRRVLLKLDPTYSSRFCAAAAAALRRTTYFKRSHSCQTLFSLRLPGVHSRSEKCPSPSTAKHSLAVDNSGVAQGLKALPELEYLELFCTMRLDERNCSRIVFRTFSKDPSARVSNVGTILSDCTFKNLKDLKLGGLQSTQEDLINFLGRQADTLRELCLCSMTLLDARWAVIFQISGLARITEARKGMFLRKQRLQKRSIAWVSQRSIRVLAS